MTNSKQQMNKSSGSAIIEYTIVFPLVLLVFFALFYAGFIMHQRSVLDAAVNRGTIYAARLLSDPQYSGVVQGAGAGGVALDCANNSYNFNSDFSIQPYRYIFGCDNDGEVKSKVENMTKQIIKANSFWNGGVEPTVKFEYHSKIIYHETSLVAEQTFPLPGILKLVGVEDEMKLKATSVQAVTDPDEFIRNVDMTLDIISMFLGQDAGDAIKNVVNKISDFSHKLFGS